SRIDYALELPRLGALILTHSWEGSIRGLNEFPPEQRPPVQIVFWSFRVMVGIGMAMLGIGVWSLLMRWRGRLFAAPWLHRAAVAMGPAGFVAVVAGWITTEVGRQPYTVYGLLKTVDSVSPIAAAAVGSSLVAFIVVYFALFGAGTFYIVRLMKKPPEKVEPDLPTDEPIRAAGINPAPALKVPGVVS
ncbi:MAG TPA: cytochrome ubiquinol oxidase subunit I, partial [Nevskia sp.]|nr:cytochrome ubiquinol oxidase subunit I [Nevskia sp.]